MPIRPLALPALVALALLAFGCAASPPRAAHHEDFRRIQRQEGHIARARAEALDPDVSCGRRCDASVEACLAAEELCVLADPLADHDARTRCLRGRRLCRETDARVAASCGCRVNAP